MALSPLSRSPVSSPSIPRTLGAEPVSLPSKALPAIQDSARSNPLAQLFKADGFDSPTDLKKGGLEAMVQELARMAQVLAKAASALNGEAGAGGQGASGLKSLGGLGGGAPGGGVPELGGEDFGVPELGGEVGGAPAGLQALDAGAPKAPAAPAAKAAAPVSDQGPSGNGKTITFTNDGKSDMNVKFTPNAGEKGVDPVTLEPGETKTVEFPDNWSGNFRSASGDGTAATLGEVKFNGGGDQTYYDVSYIEGDNAAMTMQPKSGGKVSGTDANLLASAPDSIKAKNADGSAYGIKKTTTSDVQDPGVVDYYRKHVGADQGYVIPTDDASTLATKDTHLVVHMKNLA
jgi:hypothetical protein